MAVAWRILLLSNYSVNADIGAIADVEEGPSGVWRVNGFASSDGEELEGGPDSEGGVDADEEAYMAIPELGQPDQVMLTLSMKGPYVLFSEQKVCALSMAAPFLVPCCTLNTACISTRL